MNSRKERVQNRLPFADRGSQRKRDKVADIDDEISRYFALQKPSNTYEDLLSYKNPIESRHRRSQDERSLGKDHSRKDNSSLSLAGLPEKPFLGFGSSGIASSLTASQIIRSPDKMKHFSSKKASSTRSATPYSWSISGAASLYSLRRRTRPDVTSEVSNRPPPPVLPLSAEMLNQLNRRDGGFSVDHVTTKKTLCEGHSIPRCQDIVPDKKCSEKLVRATRSPSPYKRKEQPNKHTLQYTETNSTAETENQRQENRTVLTATNENKPSIDSGLTSVSCYDKPTIQDSLESFEAELENFLRKCRMHEPQPSPQSISNRKPNSKIQHNERVTASSECLGSEKLVSSRRLVSADHDRYTLNVSQSPSTIPMRHPVTSKHHIRAVRCDHVSQSPGPFVSRSKNLGENHVFSTGLRLDNATKEIYSLGSFADAAPYAWNRHDNIYGQQAVSVDQNLSDVQNLIGLYNPSNTKGLRGFPENESFPFDVDDPDLEDDIIIGCQGRQGSHPGLNRDSSSHLENIQELNPHDMSEWSFNQPIADESSLFFHQIEPEYAQDDNLMTRRNNMLERDLYPAKFSFEEPCIERSQTQSEMIEGFQYRTSDPGSFRLNAMECNYRAHTNSNDEVTIPGFWQPNKLY